MNGILNIVNIIIGFFNDLILIDFNNYSGALNPTFIKIYNEMTIVIPYLALMICIYALFKLFFFLFGGFKKI